MANDPRPLVAGNWKMNGLRGSISELEAIIADDRARTWAADLMICREQAGLNATDLEPLLASCRPAYAEQAAVPTCSPHARFDIQDWTPLDP